jgi:hypothetical protein
LRSFLVVTAVLACFVIGYPAVQAQDSSATGVNGKWHFVLSTPGGDREVDANFAVDNDGNVTGKWGNADVAGSWKEGKLSLSFDFTSDEVGVTAPMKIDGKLDETAALTGDWAFSEYNGSFKAMRPAPDAAPAPAAAAPAPAPAPSQPHY